MVQTPTQQRDRVITLVHADPRKAFELAKDIRDPWFASQALAWVGRFSPERDFKKAIAESVRIGRLQDDPYRVAASAAWPLNALLEREQFPQAEGTLMRALSTCEDISYPGSRAEATFLLFQASKPFDIALWIPAFNELACPSNTRLHWRQKRCLRDALSMLRDGDINLMKKYAAEKAAVELASDFLKTPGHPIGSPRPFFWA